MMMMQLFLCSIQCGWYRMGDTGPLSSKSHPLFLTTSSFSYKNHFNSCFLLLKTDKWIFLLHHHLLSYYSPFLHMTFTLPAHHSSKFQGLLLHMALPFFLDAWYACNCLQYSCAMFSCLFHLLSKIPPFLWSIWHHALASIPYYNSA